MSEVISPQMMQWVRVEDVGEDGNRCAVVREQATSSNTSHPFRGIHSGEGALVSQSQAVDFAHELDVVERFLAKEGFRIAVIGGVALTAYGHPRLTLDLDVVTDGAAQQALVAFMESQDFVTLHRSSGYSNHRHADRNRGRVDFMYVQGETAEKLFASAKELPGPGGRSILVPKPEHLIAMKVQAMKDAPERTWQDLVDIAYLFRLDGVNRDEVRQYFERAGLIDKWYELTQVR